MPNPEQREVGRKFGPVVAEHPVVDLLGMGLPAVRAVSQPAPRVDDIVLRSPILSPVGWVPVPV
jgi:hypothetical protein